MSDSKDGQLAQCVEQLLNNYFADLDGEPAVNIHDMVIGHVEKTLLDHILARAEGNQTLAASMLGINRNTLRSKLKQYGILS